MNPYAPPLADTAIIPPTPLKRRRLWKLFSWFQVVVYLAAFAFPWLDQQERVNWVGYALIPLWIPVVVGVVVFAYRWRLGSAPLWKAVFWGYLPLESLSYAWPSVFDPFPAETGNPFLGLAVQAVFVIATAWALWSYAWRSPEVWGEDEGRDQP